MVGVFFTTNASNIFKFGEHGVKRKTSVNQMTRHSFLYIQNKKMISFAIQSKNIHIFGYGLEAKEIVIIDLNGLMERHLIIRIGKVVNQMVGITLQCMELMVNGMTGQQCRHHFYANTFEPVFEFVSDFHRFQIEFQLIYFFIINKQ